MTIARRWPLQDNYAGLMAAASRRYGVPEALIYAVTAVESRFVPTAKSGSGSYGLMQLIPPTAAGLGYSGPVEGLFDPATSIDLGTKYLSQLASRVGGNAAKMASAYNGGYRPSLGFGEPLTRDIRICQAWSDPSKTRCLKWYEGKAGEFGNQPYVTDVLGAYSYFAQYLAQRDGTAVAPPPPGVPVTGGTIGNTASGATWQAVAVAGGLAAALWWLVKRLGG